MAPKKAPPRRNTDVIRCERCGEEYSTTYKRCPFCDERPGGRGYAPVGGKRVSGGGPNPLQVGGLIVSLILIITAAVIVFKYISPAIFGDKGSSNVSTSQSTPGSSQDGSSGDSSQVQAANSVTLSRTEVSLAAGEDYPLTATVDPEGVKVTWSSSDTSVATVDENGTVKNVYTGTDKATVTITATAGDKSAQCQVTCTGDGTGTGTSSGSSGQTGTSSGTLAPNTEAVIVNADGGLNIRSGPGTNYEAKVSTSNGATVTVLGDAGNGWYKIKYALGHGKYDEGYVMGTYLAAK